MESGLCGTHLWTGTKFSLKVIRFHFNIDCGCSLNPHICPFSLKGSMKVVEESSLTSLYRRLLLELGWVSDHIYHHFSSVEEPHSIGLLPVKNQSLKGFPASLTSMSAVCLHDFQCSMELKKKKERKSSHSNININGCFRSGISLVFQKI